MTKSLEEYVTRETGRGGRRGETVGETVGETRDGERRETVGETGRDGLGREGGEEREEREGSERSCNVPVHAMMRDVWH